MNNYLDKDYVRINDLGFKNVIIAFLILIIIFVMLFLVKKDLIYANEIIFVNNRNAYLIVDSNMIKKIKDDKKIILNTISYDYNVEKIEEKEQIYLVYIKFDIELININTNRYSVYLNKEPIIKYIIRIMKGK